MKVGCDNKKGNTDDNKKGNMTLNKGAYWPESKIKLRFSYNMWSLGLID